MNVVKSLVDVLSKLVDRLFSRTASSSTASSTMPDFPEMKPERTQIWPEEPEDARGEDTGESPSAGSIGGFTITIRVDTWP